MTLRIGTRGSRLALAQARIVQSLLAGRQTSTQIHEIRTSGDLGVQGTSPEGDKGLWIDRILEALRAGKIDIAVHSAKDLPAEDDDDLVIGAVPARADPRDVLILRAGGGVEPGKVIGTSSIRRRAQLHALFPGVEVIDLRGNVDTRLRKVADGKIDGAVVAAAGLARLGIEVPNARYLSVDEMTPAPGQGCLAVQCRGDDREALAMLASIDHRPSHVALDAERALIHELGGGCSLPLGALAALDNSAIAIRACVAMPDGSRIARATATGEDPKHAAALAAEALREAGATRILSAVGIA